MNVQFVNKIKQGLGRYISSYTEQTCDQSMPILHITKDNLIHVMTKLKLDYGFDMPLDCTCIDWGADKTSNRFELVYHLKNLSLSQRLRVKVLLEEVPNPSAPTLTVLWEGMNWHERETFDMYGIHFEGHPKLERILMYEEFEGHPLRKDYPIDKRQPLVEYRPVNEVPTQRKPTRQLLNTP